MKPFIKYILIFIGAIALFYLGLDLYSKHAPSVKEGRVTTALHIKELPASTEKMNCPPSESSTEVILKCTFTVEQKDFPALTSGREFKETSTDLFEAIVEKGELTLKRQYLENSTKYFIELNFFEE